MLPAAGKSFIASAVLLLVAALAEEAAFRGYPLQTLSRAHLVWLGILLTSLPFGFVHLGNPNVVPGVTFANTAFAGVWLAAAYLRTRSLWFPLGVHWGWNWALGWIFGLPISGLRIVSHPLLLGDDARARVAYGRKLRHRRRRRVQHCPRRFHPVHLEDAPGDSHP